MEADLTVLIPGMEVVHYFIVMRRFCLFVLNFRNGNLAQSDSECK